MISKLRLLLAGTLLSLTVFPASADQVYSVFYSNNFGAVDDAAGTYTQISTLPIARAAGIAYDDGALYVQDMQSNLITVDPVSGASSVIGSAGLQLNSVGFAGGLNGLYEIDYGSNLYSIDPETGAATLVGATGLAANNGSWDTSISDDGTNLYFTEGGAGAIDTLYEVNPTTGVATELGSTGVTGIAGSAIVNGNLELYQYHWSGSTDYIYSAPLGSTDFTAVAVLQAQVVDGGIVLPGSSPDYLQAQTAPEPFSLLLLGSGLIGLALWGRRKRTQKSRERQKTTDFPDVTNQESIAVGSVSC